MKVRTHSGPAFDFSNAKGRRQRSVSVSEQKRPLLLPQEVKELGRDRELIFYEGVRPILARKNRYYQDPFFKKRLFPPPTGAAPPRRDSPQPADLPGDVLNTPETPLESGPMVSADLETLPRTREATVEDIDRLESLTLDDFAVDFDRVKIPQKADGERLTSEELQTAVNDFLQVLRES
jgi:type IV secretion system protein VirD4